MPFDCSSCNAACCKSISDSLGIPHHNGTCLFLENDRCSIYADRPLICRVDEGFEKYGDGMSREEWEEKNKEACASLQRALVVLVENLKTNNESLIIKKKEN